MADGRHFEKFFFVYLSRGTSDYDEIWCAGTQFDSELAILQF